jgi:hypothetical protein
MQYRYRFGNTVNADWFANKLQPEVVACGGALAIKGTIVFVTLPRTVQPETFPVMRVFSYDQVWDEAGHVLRRAGRNTGEVA